MNGIEKMKAAIGGASYPAKNKGAAVSSTQVIENNTNKNISNQTNQAEQDTQLNQSMQPAHRKVYPVIMRYNFATNMYISYLNEETHLMPNGWKANIPYTWSPDYNAGIRYNIPQEYRMAMVKALQERKEYVGTILINGTYITRIGKEYTVTTDLKGQGQVVLENEITPNFINELVLFDNVEYVGFERTNVITPEVYTGYARILYNRNIKKIFFQGKWYDYADQPEATNSRAIYSELMATSNKGIILNKDGSRYFI